MDNACLLLRRPLPRGSYIVAARLLSRTESIDSNVAVAGVVSLADRRRESQQSIYTVRKGGHPGKALPPRQSAPDRHQVAIDTAPLTRARIRTQERLERITGGPFQRK